MTHRMTLLILQLAVILIMTRFFGWFASKKLRQPEVLGEMAAGMLIGPFLLGAVPIGLLEGPLFPLQAGEIPVSPELYGIAVLGSIVLLFISGLETDVKTFLKFSGKGSAVGLGGVILPLIIGSAAAVVLLPGVSSMTHPAALFLGVISTATSIGITARILSEKRSISSPEGVTVLSAAVLDDVLSIVLLAVAAGLAGAAGTADWGEIAAIAAKAFGFWIICSALGIILAPKITRGMKRFESLTMTASVSLGISLLLAGLAELSGLAMIIGAYITGLSFSQTDVGQEIHERMRGLHNFLVPVFFCVMGMMVDFTALAGIWQFGLIFAVLAMIGKFVGSAVPALLVGFNMRGAVRIGSGMLPRGEVTLIIASVGLASGAIGNDLFAVAIMTMLLASVAAPPLLMASLSGGKPGYTREIGREQADSVSIELSFPSERTAEFLLQEVLKAFRTEGFFVQQADHHSGLFTLRKEETAVSVHREGMTVAVHTRRDQEPFVRLLMVEELLKLKDFLTGLGAMKSPDMMGADLVMGMFALEQAGKESASRKQQTDKESEDDGNDQPSGEQNNSDSSG